MKDMIRFKYIVVRDLAVPGFSEEPPLLPLLSLRDFICISEFAFENILRSSVTTV